MSPSVAPSPASPPSSVDALRALTVHDGGLHPLLKAVRSTYRAQRRAPQQEAMFVAWIERFVRLFPDEPVGRIALFHAQTFFRRLDVSLSQARRAQARAALRFLRREVLYRRPS